MNQIQIYTKDSHYPSVVQHKRPTLSHLGKSFDELVKYISDELYWMDVNPEDITCIEIFNKKEHWCNYFEREAQTSLQERRNNMVDTYLKALTNQLRDIRKRLQRGSLEKLSPEELSLIQEARDILNDIITDEMEVL